MSKKTNISGLLSVSSIIIIASIVVYLLAPAATFVPQVTYAATNGPNSGSTFANDSTIGSISWSNPGKAKNSDSDYAEAKLNDNDISKYLKATNFSFSIPDGSTIDGITVEVQKKAEKINKIKDYSARIIKNGSIGTINNATATDYWSDSDTYTSYGSTSDTWGESWTANDINASNFGFAFAANKATTSEGEIKAKINHIRITVYYTEPTPTPSPTPAPTETPTPTPEVSPSPTPEVSPSPTPEVSPSPTPEVTPSPTPGVTPTPTQEPSPTPTPEVSPSPSPTPTTNIHFVKVVCPSYSDIAGNADADNNDATGGFFIDFINYLLGIPHFLTPYSPKPVTPSEIPETCTGSEGWNFKLSSDQTQTSDVQTVGPTDSEGEINITSDDLSSTLKSLLLGGEKIWISEVENTEVANFGAIRCYDDAVNGDNLEYMQFSSVPEDVYCIAYNVNTPEQTPSPTPEPTPTQTPNPEVSPTPSPEVSPTPSPTSEPTPEPTPVITSGGGGGGGGNSGGSINPGVGSPQPAEGFVNYSNVGGAVAGTSTVNNDSGEVLGASTNACSTEYLSDYIRLGKQNNPEQVTKLQTFLNDNMNAGLPITGFYGNLTASAVDTFQVKYWQDVLLPWVPYGLETPQTSTSYVYKTTKWKINMLMCPELNISVPQIP